MSDQPKALYQLCKEWNDLAGQDAYSWMWRDRAFELEAALKAWDAELVRAHGNSVPLEVRNIIEQIRWRLLGFKLEGIGQPRGEFQAK